MEASWLAVVLIVPVLFNTESERIFEPEKIAVFRSMVFLMLAGWSIKIVEHVVSQKSLPQLPPIYRKTPIVIIVLVLSGLYCMSTLFSVAPLTSFWGSYFRQEGLLTQLSFICLFLVILSNLKNRDQIDRLISTAIISSLFICLYGILQRFHLDPLVWSSDISGRVTTTFGNPVFAAAYAAMMFPLTAVRMLQWIRKSIGNGDHKIAAVIQSIGYGFTGVAQIMLILFSQSRGPFLGFVVSIVFLFIGIVHYYRRRILIFFGLGIFGIIAGAFIWSSVLPSGAFSSLSRITAVFDNSSQNVLIRTFYWQDMTRLVLPHAPIQYSDGTVDPFNLFRPIIGYGLDSLAYTYPHFYSLDITKTEKQYSPPDRAHNQVWDLLATSGLAGLMAYQSLIAFLFYYFLKTQGFFTSRREALVYWLVYLGSGFLAAIAISMWRGLAFIGLGLTAGFCGGFFGYVLVKSLIKRSQTDIQKPDPDRFFIAAAALAVILGHTIETIFSFDTAATQMGFWLFTAIIVVLGAGLTESEFAGSEDIEAQLLTTGLKPGRKKLSGRQKPSSQFLTNQVKLMVAGVSLAILLTTLGYSFLNSTGGSSDAWAILVNSMMRISENVDSNSYGMIAVLCASWLIGWLFLSDNDEKTGRSIKWPISLTIILLSSTLLSAPYWIWRLVDLAGLVRQAPNNSINLPGELFKADNQIVNYSIYVFILIFLLSITLYIRKEHIYTRSKPVLMMFIPVVLLPAIICAYFVNLQPIRADIDLRQGEAAALSKEWPLAAALMDRSRQLAPNEAHYTFALADALVQQANALIEDGEQSKSLMARANQILIEAKLKTPVDSLPVIALADLNAQLAQQSTIAIEKQNEGKAADDLYSTALRLSPSHAELWYKRALVNVNIFKQNEAAQQQLKKALELDPFFENAYGLDGYIEIQAAISSQPGRERDVILEHAISNYETAIILGGEKFDYLVPLATLYTEMHKYQQAYHAFAKALPLAPIDTRWRINYALAQSSLNKGDKTSAVNFARQALTAAPLDAQKGINEFISKIKLFP